MQRADLLKTLYQRARNAHPCQAIELYPVVTDMLDILGWGDGGGRSDDVYNDLISKLQRIAR